MVEKNLFFNSEEHIADMVFKKPPLILNKTLLKWSRKLPQHIKKIRY